VKRLASSPNYYNDPAGPRRATFHLEGSSINYRIARNLEVYSQANDDREGILPDLPTPFTYADFAAGRDPALEKAGSVSPGDVRAAFSTRDGEDLTTSEWAHYLRKTQIRRGLSVSLEGHPNNLPNVHEAHVGREAYVDSTSKAARQVQGGA
jgi:hypothetical protein